MTGQGRGQWVAWGLLAILGLLFALLLGFSLWGRDRVFVVSAVTRGALIGFDGAGNQWSLEAPQICTPKLRPEKNVPRGLGPCDAGRYDFVSPESLTVVWESGSEVLVQAGPGQGVTLVIQNHPTLVKGTRIVLSADAWAKTGALTLSGRVEIGGQLASGATDYLVSGQYEVREQAWFSASTEVVKSGDLSRGETARIMTLGSRSGDMTDALVFAHLTPYEEKSFQINAISASGQTALALGYFGGAQPSLILPTWIDRALSSPLFITMSLMLSLLLGAGQILLVVFPAGGRDQLGDAEPAIGQEVSLQETLLPQSANSTKATGGEEGS